MFNFCLHSRHVKKIESHNYIPVGLGSNDFPPSCLRDNTGDNISTKTNIIVSGHSTIGFGRI